MNERREASAVNPNTRRQCARFGCTAIATATFTFDSTTCTVWIDAIDSKDRTGGLSAGELCSRHARSLRPPRGWELEDRRPAPDRAPAPRSPSASVPAPQLAAGPAGARLDNELRVLLNAQSPLLARALFAVPVPFDPVLWIAAARLTDPPRPSKSHASVERHQASRK